MGKHEAPGENWFALIIWTKCFHSASEMPPSASAALILVRQAGFPSCSTPSSMLAVSWQCRKAKIWTGKKNLMVSHLGFVVQQEIATSAMAALPQSSKQSSRLMLAEWPRQCLHPDIKGGRPLWKGLGAPLMGITNYRQAGIPATAPRSCTRYLFEQIFQPYVKNVLKIIITKGNFNWLLDSERHRNSRA